MVYGLTVWNWVTRRSRPLQAVAALEIDFHPSGAHREASCNYLFSTGHRRPGAPPRLALALRIH
jgi:hypothetical protein